MKFFLDIPFTDASRERFTSSAYYLKHEVVSRHFEADRVVRVIGQPFHSGSVHGSRLILLGDFTRPQTVPTEALCVDSKTWMVQMNNGAPMHFHAYAAEFLCDNLVES